MNIQVPGITLRDHRATGLASACERTRRTRAATVPHIVTPPPGPNTREILGVGPGRCCTGARQGGRPVRDQPEVRLGDRGRRRQRLPRLASAPWRRCRSAPREPTSRRRRSRRCVATATRTRTTTRTSTCCRWPSACSRSRRGRSSRVDIALNGTEAVETAVRFMRRATGRPIVDRVHGRLPRRDRARPGAIGAETSRSVVRLSRADARLRPRAVPEPVPDTVRRAAGRHGRRHRRLHPRPPAASTRSTRARSPGFVIEPVHGVGGLRRPARRVLVRARRAVPRVRLPALRGRGEDRVRSHRPPVRRRAVGRASPT